MSDATAPKKSVLTDAMERVQAKLNAETTDEQEPTTKKFFNKKNAIRVGAVAALATAAVFVLKNASKADAEETSDEATTED